MAAGRGSRNNILAGLFVIAAIVLATIVVIVMSNIGDRLKPTKSYIVRFSIAEGAEGLDKGAPVKIGGLRVGRVTSSVIVENDVTGEPDHIDATIQVPSKYNIYSDADVQLQKPLLGSGSSINIVSLTGAAIPNSDFQGPPELLKPGDVIQGHLGPPAFLAPKDYLKFQNILARADRLSAEAEPRITAIMDDAQAAVADVRKVTSDVSAKWPQWSQKASDVIDRVERASQSFDQIVQTTKDVAQAVKDGVAEARAVVEQNRPKIDAIVQNVKEFTDKANTLWAQRVTEVLDQGRAALDSARATAEEVRDVVARNRPQLDDIVANAALAAQQLKLTTVEVRASPWRLLYQPTKKELENELLYNSVRQYSEAVGELRSTAESLRALAAQGRANPAELDAMTARLHEAFARYQEQERAFLERWAKEGK